MAHLSSVMCEFIFALYVRNPHRRRLLLHVHGDVDNFVDELQLDESPRFFWTAWTVGICPCNLTGTTIILSMCCFCGLSECSANCLFFAWIWFLHIHGVSNSCDHLVDSFLCVVLLMIFGCSTFNAWTTCLVIRLPSHSDDVASFS